MALIPIAFIAPNYRDFSAYWLKAYQPGTTTPKSMALDSAGVVTVAKLELNIDGFLESAGGALVIPYIDGAYDAWLFPTEADADANITVDAIQVADDIIGPSDSGGGGGDVSVFNTVADMISTALTADTVVSTGGYTSIGDGGGARYEILDPGDYIGTTGFVDLITLNGNIARNIEINLTSSMAGVLSDGGDYTLNMQDVALKLDPTKTLHINSTDFSLSGFVLFNNGYKKVSHASDTILTWLGAGETSGTTKAIYSVNMDAAGLKTNETLIGELTVDTLEGESAFTVDTVGDLVIGDVIRVEKHICRIESINGLVIQTDRTLPIPLEAIGSDVVRLDIPNIGSEFSGPSLFKFAPDATTQNYGFGIVIANSFNIKVNNFYGLHNSSKICEMFYCADSEAADIQQYEPADIGAGQGYALRISNGNDNTARRIQSSKGRHCVDITFSHRNKVFDCKDFDGVSASYLTHFNGSLYNDFIRCELHNCEFGVSISYGGDLHNRFIDGLFMESRGVYRPEVTTQWIRCKFITKIVDNTRVMIVPSESTGLGWFNAKDWEIDTINDILNSDFPMTALFDGGSLTLRRQDGLFRGIASATPGQPATDADLFFEFKNVKIDAPVRLGRRNINAKATMINCNIEFDEQPFGEDMGTQRYHGCDIKDRTGGNYLITVSAVSTNELIGNILRNITLPFRHFTGFPTSGKITFGDNQFLEGSEYEVGGLNNMTWTNAGYVIIPINLSNGGTVINDTTVYIESNFNTDPFKRQRQLGVWKDWITTE